MALLIVLLFPAFVFTALLLSYVSLRVRQSEDTIIIIDILIFRIFLSIKKGEKLSNASVLQRIKQAAAALRAMNHLISHGNLTVYSFDFTSKNQSPDKAAVLNGVYASLAYALLAHLESTAKATTLPYYDDTLAHDKTFFDLSLEVRLFRLIYAYVHYIKSTKDIKRKRGQNNVRNKNERNNQSIA